MTADREKHRFEDCWETIAVTALSPGWRNVWREDDGTLTVTPCPALLLQECRETEEWWGPVGGMHRKTTRHEPPYKTRVVYADGSEGTLSVACEVFDYVRTLAPGEDLPEGTEGGSPA